MDKLTLLATTLALRVGQSTTTVVMDLKYPVLICSTIETCRVYTRDRRRTYWLIKFLHILTKLNCLESTSLEETQLILMEVDCYHLCPQARTTLMEV